MSAFAVQSLPDWLHDLPSVRMAGRPLMIRALLSNHANTCYVSIAIRMMMGSGMPSSSSSIERIVFSLD